jgi:hypothetical protein
LLRAAGVTGEGEREMNAKRNGVMLSLGLIALLTSAAPRALAQCSQVAKMVKPSAWTSQLGATRVLRTHDDEGKTMVGMWHVIFTADTSGGASIPATVVDNALVVWHSDHTEIMNSVRPPQDGNFCLGVWKQINQNDYYLNHFAWFSNEFPNSNPNGIGDPVGPTQIQEWVTLGPDGNHFTGAFHLTAYDLSNNVIADFKGTLAGTRITVTTTEKDLLGN